MINCRGDKIMENNITKNYFGTWEGYGTPIQLSYPLPKKEALTRKAYYIGYYDLNEKLIGYDKYLDGKIYGHTDYKYNENGRLIESENINYISGYQLKITFDEKGKMIKREFYKK